MNISDGQSSSCEEDSMINKAVDSSFEEEAIHKSAAKSDNQQVAWNFNDFSDELMDNMAFQQANEMKSAPRKLINFYPMGNQD